MAESCMMDSFKCYICLDYATEAVETDCCHQIGCLKCLGPLRPGPCACCKVDKFTYKPTIFVRRLIDDIAIPCPNECAEKPRKGDMDKHLKVCEKRVYSCPVEKCEFTGIFDEYAVHIYTEHRRSMVEKFNDSFVDEVEKREAESATKKYLFPTPMSSDLLGKLKTVFASSEAEPGRFICNLNGDPVTMAANGKFYCDKPDIAPSYGSLRKCSYKASNCGQCMLLDVTFRKLAKARLVNNEGDVSQTDPCVHKCTFLDHSPMRYSCLKAYCGYDPVFYCSKCNKTNPCSPCNGINYAMQHSYGEHYAFIFQ